MRAATLTLALALFGPAVLCRGGAPPRSGPTSVRIESEHKLTLPVEKTEDVWAYLASRYRPGDHVLFDDPRGLRFQVDTSEEFFTDAYYDTPTLALLKQEGGMRLRTREIPGVPQARKHGRTLIQVKARREGEPKQHRSEEKFALDPAARMETPPHVLPRELLAPKHRPRFARLMSGLQVDAARLEKIMTVHQRRRRVYLSLGNRPFATITLDEVSSERWGRSIRMSEVEIELDEITYTGSGADARWEMERVGELVMADLLGRFGYLRADQTPKYTKVFRLLEDVVPLYSCF